MGRVYLQFYRDQDAGVRFVVVMTESMTVAPIDLQIENWEKSTMFITLAEEILGFTTAGQFAEIINSKKRSLMN